VALSSALPTPIAVPALPVIPLRALAPWAIFGLVISMLLLYFVGVEQGSFSLLSGSGVHEFVHDGRHLLGFPCH
jgi:Probable cobalt transporter subunit (CbtB)